MSQAEPPTTVSAAIHTIRMRRLMARIQAVMYPQTGREMPVDPSFTNGFKHELDEWLAAAPEQLPANRANKNAFGGPEWWQIMYQQSILTLYRQQLVQPVQNSTMVPSVHLTCAHAGQVICSCYRQLYMTQRLNDTWGALHVLFLGGLTFLHCLWTSPEVRATYRLDKVSATCTSCIMVLAVMAERWVAVKPYRDVFDMLSSATQSILVDGVLNTDATMPVLSTIGHDQFITHLSSMSELGMCSSVEQLISNMLE